MPKGEFPRQSFLHVLKAQTEIRETLREWAEKSKIPDDEEKIEFREKLNKGTLGLQQKVSFGKIHDAWANRSLPHVINLVLSCPIDRIRVGSRHDSKHEKKIYDIGTFWKKILERLNEEVFNDAINLSIKISPERQEKTGKTHSQPRG